MQLSRTAIVAGATGLVGRELVSRILEEDYYSELIILTRSRSYECDNKRVKIVRISSFDDLEEIAEDLVGNHYFCVIGTNRRRAGTEENYMKIEVDYPVSLAKIAQKSAAFEQFLVVSALGADSASPLLYNRAKGVLEQELTKLGLPSLKIFKPSLVKGKRKDFRIFERLAKVVSNLFHFLIISSKKKLWSIYAHEVAGAMLVVAKKNKKGLKKFKPKKMIKLVHS